MVESILGQLESSTSIVLVRLRSLGDSVLATSAFALLRQAIPDASVHVVMDGHLAEVLDGQPDIDGVLALETDTGVRGKIDLVRRVRALRPALCVDMHGGSTAAWLAALSGAKWRVGCAHFRHSWAYNVRIPRAQEVLGREPAQKVHTAEHHAATMIHLGAPHEEIPAARLGSLPSRDESRYAVIHAGAAYETKRWAVEHFRVVGKEIERSHGLRPVFVLGPGDVGLAEELSEFDVRGALPLTELKSLLAGAQLFVGNDSGPAHVAAAFGVPAVVIFGSSDSAVWHPWRTPHRVIETQWDCKPCPGDRCYAFDEPRCILSVRPEQVLSAIDDLVASGGPAHSTQGERN